MGAPNRQTSGPGGKKDSPGKEAMLEAMKRQQMNDMVNQSQRMQQQPSSEYFPSTQGRQVMNQPVPQQEFKAPAKGGIAMGPGRSGRFSDEEAADLLRRNLR